MTATALARPRVHPVTFARLVRSEHLKLRTLRSTWWALALAVAVLPLMAVMRTTSVAAIADEADPAYLVGPVYVTSGVMLAQLVLCGLAVVAVTAEYRTGLIRSTLTAAPTRLPVLGAQLLVVVVTALVTGVVGVLAAWAAAAPLLGEARMSVDLTQPEHLRIMAGVPLYLAAVAAFAYGVGAALRSSAAGIASVLGLVFVVEPAFAYLPSEALQRLGAYLPTAAGSRLLTSDVLGSVVSGSRDTTLGPWAGYGVLLAWAALAVGVAAVLLRRRDA